jgi:Zn-dependent M32 family carboxypeptidase
MMRTARIAVLALPLFVGVAQAQDAGDVAVGRRTQAGAPARRQQMEQRLRQELWRIAKERMGMTDAQMSHLTEVNQRYDAERRILNLDERLQRETLRAEMLAKDSANQDRIAAALDRLVQLQRQRIDIVAKEQKEFATFMTPLQRAQYGALQEQLRRRVEELRRARADGGGNIPPRR